jgi:2-polyprenyl-3-methyl-5-hydroxy-6-metoxy-1,4-benzoquinol methylase
LKSRKQVQEFWKNPNYANLPEKYLHGKERTDFLVGKIQENFGTDASILEIGCNVGRNLHGLYSAGYKNLHGIEINENAIAEMQKHFPKMAENIKIYNLPAEYAILNIPPNSIDVIFTMAVLEHIHDESDFIFHKMKEIAKKAIITIEDEVTVSERHEPRNYAEIFNCKKFQEKESACNLKLPGLSKKFVYRYFEVI